MTTEAPTTTDLKVTACNLGEAISECVEGALCYVIDFNMSMGEDSRICLLMRSRSGRWIKKYEALYRLKNFRLKTIPPEHPLFARLRPSADTQSKADIANTLSEFARTKRAAKPVMTH